MFALARLRLPTCPHHPPHPPTPYRLNPCYYRHRKTTSKTWGIQIACRISYEILATYITRLLSVVSLAWLYCTIREPQPIQYLKSVFLEILNVITWSVFQLTYIYCIVQNIRGTKLSWCLQNHKCFSPNFLIISHRAARN